LQQKAPTGDVKDNETKTLGRTSAHNAISGDKTNLFTPIKSGSGDKKCDKESAETASADEFVP
jgi:hypothetical protein